MLVCDVIEPPAARLALGEPPRPFEVLPLRMGDVARLEVLAIEGTADPLELLPPDGAGGPEADQEARLAWVAARVRREARGLPLAGLVASNGATMGFAVQSCLRRHRLDVAAAVAIAGGMTPGQWRRLLLAAVGGDPMEAVTTWTDERLGLPPAADPPREPEGLGDLAARLCRTLPPAVVARLTIPAARAIAGNADPGLSAALVEVRASRLDGFDRDRARRRFWAGLDPVAPGSAGGVGVAGDGAQAPGDVDQ
jgi:hypothetical protein